MTDFRDRLRQTRSDSESQRQRQADEQAEQQRRQRDQKRDVDIAADELEAHIRFCLKQFLGEFVEFRYDEFVRDGKGFRVYFDDPVTGPGGKAPNRFHQISFHVRRYHDYADVEVECKMIVANAEQRRHTREEDVYEGDPAQLRTFVEQRILDFTKLYTERRGW